MMKEPPQVRIIKAYGIYSKGQVIRPPASFREFLLQHKYVEMVEDDVPVPCDAGPAIETTMVDPAPRKAVRRRGRPRRARVN